MEPLSNGSSRRKGKTGEREVAAILNGHLIPAERAWEDSSRYGGQEYGDLRLGADLTGIYYPEVRRRENLSIPTWLAEIDEKAALVNREPLLITRKSRTPWWATVKLDHLIQLWKGTP